MTKFIYCFIRKDLPFTQQIIQMSHAAFEAGQHSEFEVNTPNICLFEVANELELLRASEHLRDNKIDYRIADEPDFNYGYTSICTEVIESMEIRAKLKGFKLYKYE